MKEIRMCVETDIELHTITSILTDSLREKEMFYADDNRRFADNMLLFIYCKFRPNGVRISFRTV